MQGPGPPRRRQGAGIARLSSQLQERLQPAAFPQQARLRVTDPGYGTPQAGSSRQLRQIIRHMDRLVSHNTTDTQLV